MKSKFDSMNNTRGGTMNNIYDILRPTISYRTIFNDLKSNCTRLALVEEEKKNADTQEKFDYFHEKEFILLMDNSRLYEELIKSIENTEVTNENVFELKRTRQIADSLCHTGYINIK